MILSNNAENCASDSQIDGDNGIDYIDEENNSEEEEEIEMEEENVGVTSDEDDNTDNYDSSNSDEEMGEDSDNSYVSEEEDISCVDGEDNCSNNEELDLIEHILSKRNEVKKRPKIITIKNSVEDLKFHRSDELLAVATIKGDVLLIKYGGQCPKKVKLLENHMKACRAIEFSTDGKFIISVSVDKSIVVCDTESYQLLKVSVKAHENPLTVVNSINEKVFVTGDSNGCVRFWDLREQNYTLSTSLNDEYISSLVSSGDYLAVMGSDGTVSAFDVRKPKKLNESFSFDGCLSSGALFRDETRLIVGTTDGEMVFFKWGEFEFPLEKYGPCKSISINQVAAARSQVAAIGCEDGRIRALSLYPNRDLGIIGSHNDSIESLAVSYDCSYLASACFDNTIKIWDLSYMDTVMRYKKFKCPPNDVYHLPSSEGTNKSDFFCELK